MAKPTLKTSLLLSDDVIVAGRISSSQDGIVVMGGGYFPMPYSRTRKLPENCCRYRELSRRMFVKVELPVLLIQDMKMRLSKTISV